MLPKLSFQLALQGIPLRYNKVMQSRTIASNVKTQPKANHCVSVMVTLVTNESTMSWASCESHLNP